MHPDASLLSFLGSSVSRERKKKCMRRRERGIHTSWRRAAESVIYKRRRKLEGAKRGSKVSSLLLFLFFALQIARVTKQSTGGLNCARALASSLDGFSGRICLLDEPRRVTDDLLKEIPYFTFDEENLNFFWHFPCHFRLECDLLSIQRSCMKAACQTSFCLHFPFTFFFLCLPLLFYWPSSHSVCRRFPAYFFS